MRRTEDGATLRDHLNQLARATGERPEELIEPELHPGCEIIWQMFLSLHAGRDGDKPLAWRDIAAWRAVLGMELDSFELDVLMAMDRAAMAARMG